MHNYLTQIEMKKKIFLLLSLSYFLFMDLFNLMLFDHNNILYILDEYLLDILYFYHI